MNLSEDVNGDNKIDDFDVRQFELATDGGRDSPSVDLIPTWDETGPIGANGKRSC